MTQAPNADQATLAHHLAHLCREKLFDEGWAGRTPQPRIQKENRHGLVIEHCGLAQSL